MAKKKVSGAELKKIKNSGVKLVDKAGEPFKIPEKLGNKQTHEIKLTMVPGANNEEQLIITQTHALFAKILQRLEDNEKQTVASNKAFVSELKKIVNAIPKTDVKVEPKINVQVPEAKAPEINIEPVEWEHEVTAMTAQGRATKIVSKAIEKG